MPVITGQPGFAHPSRQDSAIADRPASPSRRRRQLFHVAAATVSVLGCELGLDEPISLIWYDDWRLPTRSHGRNNRHSEPSQKSPRKRNARKPWKGRTLKCLSYQSLLERKQRAYLTRGPKKFANEEALEFGERVFGLFDPSPELLQQTINAVFWASMSKEEGKPVLPRVMFNDIRGPYCRIEPHHVSPESIRKLSPFLDVASNGLHINRNAKIVGVGPWRNRDIGIVARRPGQIAVLDGTLVLGVLENGNWIVVGGSSLNVGLILQRAFSENAFTERFRKATVIVQVAMQARLTQRGATFVMLPGGKGAGIGRPNYSIESFAALPQSLEDWRRADVSTPDMLVRTQIVELSRNAIAITGAGAGIDGATIIDESDLHLTGFGAKISAEDDDLDVRLVALPVAEIQSKKKKDLGGMRHQMAARLVQMNHEAMVITVSQDGPVSLFAWVHQEGCVVVMKHLDRYFEAEAELGR